MKTLFIGFAAAVLLSSCDPNSDKRVGDADRFNRSNQNSGSGGGGGVGNGGGGQNNGASSTTDAPLDGGLSVLLVAGAAYGANRVRRQKKQKNAA